MPLIVGFVVGAGLALALGLGLLGAVAAGIVGAIAAFALPIAYGLAWARRGRATVPVDLTAELPSPLTRQAYETLPLAMRNAVIARTIAEAAGRAPDAVAALLPEMMGRTKVSSLATQRAAASLAVSVEPARLDRAQVATILAAEVDLAAQSAMPPNDRARAVAEQRLGQAVTLDLMREALLSVRFPRLGRISLADMVSGVPTGELDLAFVVGSIRTVGEKHQQEFARLG